MLELGLARIYDQLNSNHRLNSEVTDLRVQVEQLTLRLNAAQQQQQDAEAVDAMKASAEGTIQALRQDMEILLTEIEGHKTTAALAEAETARQKQTLLAEANEKLAKLDAEIREEFKQELADRDYAFQNAKETIESLEKEVEDLQGHSEGN